MNTERMILALTSSKNELVAKKCLNIILGATTIEEELKYCGSFMKCVLTGDYETALLRADSDNYFALTGKNR